MTVPHNLQLNETEVSMDVFISKDSVGYVVSDEDRSVKISQELNVEVNSKADMQVIEDFFTQSGVDVAGENVCIHIENSVYQLIPSELFREKDAPAFFNLMFGNDENEIFQTAVLPKWNLHLVYRIPQVLSNFLNDFYPEAEQHHLVFTLLKNFVHKNEDAVYLHLRKNAVDMALVKENKLLFFNSFDVKNAEDICYHTLNIYEQFSLSVENYKLKIKKNKPENQSEIELLKEYIVAVEVL